MHVAGVSQPAPVSIFHHATSGPARQWVSYLRSHNLKQVPLGPGPIQRPRPADLDSESSQHRRPERTLAAHKKKNGSFCENKRFTQLRAESRYFVNVRRWWRRRRCGGGGNLPTLSSLINIYQGQIVFLNQD